jgi:hypothetical protein
MRNKWLRIAFVAILLAIVIIKKYPVSTPPSVNSKTHVEPLVALEARKTPPERTTAPENKKSTEATPTKFIPPSPEKIYCDIARSAAHVPLEGPLKMWTLAYEKDENGEGGTLAMIQSSTCPPGLFSKVRLNSEGHIKDIIDCRSTSREELALSSGIQGNIREEKPSTNKINMAISGEGFFVEDCEKQIFYIRDGRFLRAMDGTVMTPKGCVILDNQGRPLTMQEGEELDEQGCGVHGNCVAVVSPDKSAIKYINEQTLLATGDFMKGLRRERYVFYNSLEDVDDKELGWLGPRFQNLPAFVPPKNCP